MFVHHIAYRADDPEKLAAFYRDIFDLSAECRPNGSYWLPLGEHGRLMIEQRQEGEPEFPLGSKDFLALATTPEGIKDFEARCAAHNIPIEARTEFTRYIRDPQGRRVGVSCYPFEKQ